MASKIVTPTPKHRRIEVREKGDYTRIELVHIRGRSLSNGPTPIIGLIYKSLQVTHERTKLSDKSGKCGGEGKI